LSLGRPREQPLMRRSAGREGVVMSGDERILVEYLRRAYHAVDGLWFVMVEKAHDFDHALELDRGVWEVLAKIQARKARELTGCAGSAPADLVRCFSLKLTADGHAFEATATDDEVRFTIHDCPWLELLRKSDRQELAARVAQAICPTEGRVWCEEFGGAYEFGMPTMACSGAGRCEMRFVRRPAD
jgi:predicted ArsR family transcriptional regulator